MSVLELYVLVFCYILVVCRFLSVRNLYKLWPTQVVKGSPLLDTAMMSTCLTGYMMKKAKAKP